MIESIRQIERELKRALAEIQRPLLKRITEGYDLRRQSFLLAQQMQLAVYGSVRKAWAAGVSQARREAHASLFFQDEEIPARWWEWYTATTDAALHRYAEQTRRDIEQVVWRSTVEGWDNERLTDAIKDIVQDLLTWKAERIARTETMRLWNMGRTFELAQYEEIIGFEYSVVLDPRTSHICRPLAGLKVRKDQLQSLPPLHPHCRTILLPIFVGEQPNEWDDPAQARPAKGFDVLPASLLQGVISPSLQ